MLGLRLDEPLIVTDLGDVVDETALLRLERLGLVERGSSTAGARQISLTPRGRVLGGGVTADLLA
jgi:hypothetical protein